MPKAVSPELLAFKAELDLHRQSHPPRSRLPDQLWQQAVALLARHSISAVCRTTNLHQQGLRRHAVTAGVIPAAPTPAAPRFIRLQTPDLPPPPTTIAPPIPPPAAAAAFDVAATTPAYRLTLERADGSRLTLSAPAADWTRIEAVCALFLRP